MRVECDCAPEYSHHCHKCKGTGYLEIADGAPLPTNYKKLSEGLLKDRCDLQKIITDMRAEQAKAQEAHQNELGKVWDEGYEDARGRLLAEIHCLEMNHAHALAAAEQTSLASQAKLIRKCAEIVQQGPHAPQCKTVANHSWIVPEDCDCGTSFTLANILELITPAMLQAEEAALAAEKATAGDQE